MEHERIIYILEYLQKYTDDEHSVSIKDIKEYLEKNCGFKNVSSLTIRRDLERLEASGKHLTVTKGAHNTSYYSLNDNGFTFNEIRFLVDSISINKFLSDSQKQKLIKKFEGMCSSSEVRKLISRIHLTDIANPNLDLLDNLEKIHIIISEKRKINFDYGRFDTHRQVNYYSKRRNMLPSQVVYFENRFYLKCINEDDGKVRTYRIDRMKNIRGGDKSRKNAAIPKMNGVVLDIFEPEYFEYVSLRVKRFLLDDMLEQFGNYASFRDDADDSESVIINVRIGISQSFYRWALKYGENIEILAPQKLRDEICEKLKIISEIYEK